jgi:uncharacterized protein YbgA (DUF1722 family)
MKKVDEIVSQWTDEERGKLKDLIEECREREKQLIENSKSSQENLNGLMHSLTCLFSCSQEVREKIEKLADDLLGIYLHLYHKEMLSS